MSQAPEGKDRRDLLERALRAVEDLQSKVDTLQREKREAIAVVGMGCRFPGHVASPEEYWQLLRDGVDGITEVPSSRWDIDAFYDPDPDAPGKMYTRMGGFLDDIDKFDAQFFGISPRETLKTDPQQRLAVEVSWEALENAAIPPHKLLGSQTGVFLGITNTDYSRLTERAGLGNIDAYHLTGNFLSFAPGRVAYFFGFQGPTLAVDTACSSSGVAVHLACQSLRNRECNLALAGGVNLILSPEISITSTKARTLSPDGRCKTFDSSANGYVRSEGCGIVVLKRLSDAIADGDSIRAVIRGSAVNQDGASSGLTVPNKLAQAAVMRQALERAGLGPAQIQYIEAHGTGTPLGDPIEIRALAAVYNQGRSPKQPLVVGTAKTNIGHAESAAGVAGLMKTVLSLQHRTIPPHLHFKQLNPAINLDEIPAVVPTTAMEWQPSEGRRVAGVSSFGGSGTVAHMIVEEAPSLPVFSEQNLRTSQLFCLSAKNPAALGELAKKYSSFLAETPATLGEICFTADAGRSHFSSRLSVVASSKEELKERLENHAVLGESTTASEAAQSSSTPKIVFLFTGQGGQYINMGKQLYEGEPVFRAVIDRCDEVLRPHLPQSLVSVMYPQGEETPLDETRFTHVAMFAIQYGLTALWRSWGVEPAIIMGHSVGEIVAATAAGQLSFEDGLQLMRERGRLMQELPSTGMMASLLASEQQALAALAPYRDRVSIAAINGPESTVISGEKEAILEILAKLEGQGIKVKPLKVSNAFHSPLVEPVLEEFENFAKGLRYGPVQTPLFSSMRLERVEDRPLDAPYWRHNLRNTVRFSEAIQKLYVDGYRLFLEIGPSPILVGMGNQCVPPGDSMWLTSLRQGREDYQQILETLGVLYESGIDVNWDEFYRNRRTRKVVLPSYAFQKERYWVESASTNGRNVAANQGTDTGHPLLGKKLNSAVPLFETELNISAIFLSDHRVFGQAVLPATAYLEIALAAANATFGGTHFSVNNTIFIQPLRVPEQGSIPVQVSVTETAPGMASFKIFSQQPSGADGISSWILHATGDLANRERGRISEIRDFARLKQACTQRIRVEEHYGSLQSRGIEFGESFRGINSLWSGAGEVLAEVSAPGAIKADLAAFNFHPALLDACLQAIGPLLPVSEKPRTYLPQRIESFQIYSSPSDELWSHLTLRNTDGPVSEVIVDVEICEGSGTVVAELRGLVLRPASSEQSSVFAKDSIDKCLFAMDWERADLLPAVSSESAKNSHSPGQVAIALSSWCESKSESKEVREFLTFLPGLESLCTNYFCRALQELGFKFVPGRTFTSAAEARELGILEKHHRLLDRIFEMLKEDGYLVREGSRWKVLKSPGLAYPEEECSSLLQRFPACAPELEMVSRCGRALASGMRGECDILHILFPNGSVADMERLYRESAFFAFYNQLAAEALARWLPTFSSQRPLRVLEIGAGTGSLTASVLPLLAKKNSEYVFTDASGLFLSKAREKFSSYPFVEYRLLDIEKPPTEQGFAENSFDLILAANVLHATADLKKTLSHVEQLLASKGLLLLVECTSPFRFEDIIVGLTDGWWKFTDERRSHALQPAAAWKRLLEANGFAEIAYAPADRQDGLAKQALIIAQVPAKQNESWLILEDSQGLGKEVSSFLETSGRHSIRVSAGEQYVRRGNRDFEVNPTCVQDFEKLVSEITSKTSLAGILYLWPLNACHEDSQNLGTLKANIRQGCSGIVNLLKALVSSGKPAANNLWIVTRGVFHLDSESKFFCLAQAPASAIGSTISLEYPEIRCVRLDLAPTAHGRDAETIVEEITRGKNDELVAIRDRQRFAARLVPAESDKAGSKGNTGIAEPYRIAIPSPGILDDLSLAPLERRTPGPGEVEIEVRATGLGFRDVLMALGKYPEPATVFGYECAGIISRVGPGVSRFHQGQRVFAVGPGGLASHLTMSQERVVSVPASIDNEAAATIPSAFLTAHYSLHHLGHIAEGDRVLIHAAAGGVGLAAIQIAHNAKAEIFATAGSPEKRAYLKSLGIAHVFDSRSLDFFDQIMKLTGGKGVDIVLNSLTGEFIPSSLALTAANGRFLEIGANAIWNHEEVTRFKADITYHTINLASTFEKDPALLRKLFDEILPKFSSGALKPLPLRSFPAADPSSAFRFMAQAKHIGKIVITHRRPQEGLLNPNASYLITGGLKGLGLLVAQWMAERGATHLVLLGRSEPSPEALGQIREIEKSGVRVVVSQGDASNREHLSELFAKFGSTLPELRGIIHSAGIVDDAVLAQQNWERFEHVMAPKVDGSWHLHELSIKHPLDFFVLFSSAVSMLGSAGQANHVAACGFEDALSQYRRSVGLPALAINWGPWDKIGAATRGAVNERLAKKGFRPLAPVLGLAILEELLKQGHVQVGAVSIDWSQYVDSLPTPQRSRLFTKLLNRTPKSPDQPAAKPIQKVALLEQIAAVPARNRRTVLEGHVREQAIKVLGLKPSFKLDPHQGLATLGMDSLMTIELKNRLQASVGKTLPSTIVFDHPTVAALALYLEKQVFGFDDPEQQPGKDARVQAQATDLEEMSDDEAEAILLKELSDSQNLV